MTKEFPKRGDYFCGVAVSISAYAKNTNVFETNVFAYLGKPDLVAKGTNQEGLEYLYWPSKSTNQWVANVMLTGGKVDYIGFSPADSNELAAIEGYRIKTNSSNGP